MKNFTEELYQISTLYHSLDFSNESDVLSEITNKNNCENILAIIQSILNKDATHTEALLWRVTVNNLSILDNTTVAQQDCELIINTTTDIDSKFKAYDWLVYIYTEKLSLNTLAIETLENKLIDITNIKDNRSLQDQAFGETYHKLGYIYQSETEDDKALDYYLKSFKYAPKIPARNYDGGLLLLEREQFDEATTFLSAHFEVAEPQQSKLYAKEIETLFNDGKLKNHWELFSLFYPTAFDIPLEFGYKNRQEFVDKYLPFVIEETKNNPTNATAWRMLANNFLYHDKNAKKAFENLTKYYDLIKSADDLTIESYYNCAELLNKDLRTIDLTIGANGADCYHVLTTYLEKGNDAQDRDDHVSAQMYYEIAKKYGLAGYKVFDSYFNSAEGSAIDNEPHVFAMLCNNLGIVIKQVSWYQHQSYLNDDCKFASDAHWQGYQISPFWENLENGMEISWRNENGENLEKFSLEVLAKFDYYQNVVEVEKWYQTMFYLITAYRKLEKYEEAKEIYLKTVSKFEQSEDENKTIVSLVLDVAIVYFNFLLAKELHNQSLSYVNDLFKNPVYQKMQYAKAESFKCYFLGKAHLGLKDNNEAQKYFKLITDNFATTELLYIKDLLNDAKTNLNIINAGENFDDKIVSLYKTSPNRLFEYPLKAKEENIKYLKSLLSLVTNNKMPASSAWVEKNMYIGFELREKRNDVEEIYDSFFYIYLKNEDLGIRYELVEWQEMESGFLGLTKKLVHKNAFYVCFYTNYTANGSDTRTEFEMASENMQVKAQYLWKEWINKLQSYKP